MPDINHFLRLSSHKETKILKHPLRKKKLHWYAIITVITVFSMIVFYNLIGRGFNMSNTQAEAFNNINDAMKLWIDVALENGDPVPEPMCHRLMYA